MSQQELLKRVVETLTQAGMEYMVTGSIVSSLQGEPRSSHDIDIVVPLQRLSAAQLTRLFPPPKYYLEQEAIREAFEHGGMFNLMDTDEVTKVDFWALTGDAFDQSRFARRYVERYAGIAMPVSRPEDTILMKLRWARMSGGSERQYGDCLRVYELQYAKMNLEYLRKWAETLSVEDLLAQIEINAKPVKN